VVVISRTSKDQRNNIGNPDFWLAFYQHSSKCHFVLFLARRMGYWGCNPRNNWKNMVTCRRLSSTFSQFFVDKLKRISDRIAVNLTYSTTAVADRSYSGPSLDSFSPVTATDVHRLLVKMPAKSSPLDIVPTSLLKACADQFAVIISGLANLSFHEGKFPVCFKTAELLPLLKKSDADQGDPANFRPISNLSTISKVLERLALAQVETTSVELSQLLPVSVWISYWSLHRNGTARVAQRRLHSRLRSTMHRCHRSGHFSRVRYDQSQDFTSPSPRRIRIIFYSTRLGVFVPVRSPTICEDRPTPVCSTVVPAYRKVLSWYHYYSSPTCHQCEMSLRFSASDINSMQMTLNCTCPCDQATQHKNSTC